MIDSFIGTILAQLIPTVEGIFGTRLLDITGVGTDFELVYEVGINAVVGKSKMLVVGLADIQDAFVLAVDEDMGWLPCLTIEVKTGTTYYLLQGSILESATCIVAAITELQGLVAIVGLAVEEGVIHVIGTI